MNNKIAYNNNGSNPIIVDYHNGDGPAVVFNYNFVKIINKCGESNDYYEVDNEEDEIKNIFSANTKAPNQTNGWVRDFSFI